MNFAAAYFTNLGPDGPNEDFVPSMRARLLYAHRHRLGHTHTPQKTESPYAPDAQLPHLPPVPQTAGPSGQIEPRPELETYIALIAGRFNEAARLRIGREMRTRDAVKIYTEVISNGLRCDSCELFPDVNTFTESLKDRAAVFPIHPALVIGPGFNLADTLFHPYYGARHVAWSLTEDLFAFRIAELYEERVRSIVRGTYSSTDQSVADFLSAIEEINEQVQPDVELIDTSLFLKAWADNPEYSFAPLVRLYAAFTEPVFPIANFMQVFNKRITAAVVTEFALNV